MAVELDLPLLLDLVGETKAGKGYGNFHLIPGIGDLSGRLPDQVIAFVFTGGR